MPSPQKSVTESPSDPWRQPARTTDRQHCAQLQSELEQTRHLLAQAKRENQQFMAMLNHLPAMIGYWDAAQINRFANNAYDDWFGIGPGEVSGRHLSEVLGPRLYALNRPFIDKALAGQPQHFERVIPNPRSGQQRISLADYVPHLEGDQVQGFFVMISDISAQKEAEAQLQRLNAELTASQSQLRTMSAHKEKHIENERKHFSREVHDELGQHLTALRMDLLILEMKFCSLNQELCQKVQEMKATLEQAFASVRSVAGNMRPTALDMGLTEALRWLCAEFSRKSGVPCHFEVQNPATPDEGTSIVLFRIVQESLTNSARHAQATRVDVLLQWFDGALQISVQDDGRGFDQNAQARSGYGLLGMRERALSLGGEVCISSAPEKGTRVAVRVPWQPDTGGAGT